MNTKTLTRRLALVGLSVGLLGCATLSTGCQATYAADVRNTTPQPLYAQLVERTDGGPVSRAGIRLGPGDRGALGPVIAREGKAYLVLDTTPNPGTPVTVPLAEGTTVLEVTQEGDKVAGHLQVRIIGGSPPVQEMPPPAPPPGKTGMP